MYELFVKFLNNPFLKLLFETYSKIEITNSSEVLNATESILYHVWQGKLEHYPDG